MNKTVGILTMEAHESRSKDSVGSSRIRGTWLVKHWPEAEAFKIGAKYDAVIFQKAYFVDYMRIYHGVKILDMCDPDWLEGKPVKECIDLCDAVTTSSEALAEFIRQMTHKPVICITDRVDLQTHTPDVPKEHSGRAQGVVWYGYSANHKLLDPCLPALARLGLSLTVISEMPYIPSLSMQGIDDEWVKKNIRNVKFDPDMLNDEITRGGDIVLNPKSGSGRFKYKSENKTYISWALRMPVAHDADDLERFMDGEARQAEADLRRKEVEEKWRTEISVDEYKKLIASLTPIPLP